MKRICVVCWANICRSPMAEVILQNKLVERGLDKRYEAFSSGVSREKHGQPIEPSAIRVLKNHGLTVPERQAWALTEADYDRFDYFLCVDMDILMALKLVFFNDTCHKVGLLMGYTDFPRNVEDPYMTGKFEYAFEQLSEGCDAFLDALQAADEFA